MIKTTLDVGCDSCDAFMSIPSAFSLRTDTTPHWEFDSSSEEYKGNVIIHDVGRFLQDAGWMVYLTDEPLIRCAECDSKIVLADFYKREVEQ